MRTKASRENSPPLKRCFFVPMPVVMRFLKNSSIDVGFDKIGTESTILILQPCMYSNDLVLEIFSNIR